VKNRLKVLRAERDWTQARLATELDVSRQTVNAIEKGKFDPSLPLAFRLKRIDDYQTTVDASKTGPSTQTRFMASPSGVSIFTAQPAQPPTAQAMNSSSDT